MDLPATIRAARDHLEVYALRRQWLREGKLDDARRLTAQLNLDPLRNDHDD